MEIPFSPSCERNKEPILQALKKHLEPGKRVLEIGSGTAQHAFYLTKSLPGVIWQPTERSEGLATLSLCYQSFAIEQLLPPQILNVQELENWPSSSFQVIFTANTFHIMPQENLSYFFKGSQRALEPEGKVFIYGPFKYKGEFTSESNYQFEKWLKSHGRSQGQRDFEVVLDEAMSQGFALSEDLEMPANNRMLIFEKIG